MSRRLLATVFVFFVVTLGLGLVMRWDLATGLASRLGLSFPNLRHAHSHLGYYGVLTLGWWITERRAGLSIERPVWVVYLASTLAACVGFALVGYVPATIALSTLVALGWLYVGAQRWRTRKASERTWLDAALPGLVIGVGLIPFVAVFARRDSGLSRELAHVFVTVVLLTVFIPAAWQALGIPRRTSLLAFVPLAVMTSVRIVFGAAAPAVFVVASVIFAVWTAWIVVTGPLDGLVKIGWLALPLCVIAGALSSMAHADRWRIAGLHLLFLGPVLTSLYSTGNVPGWLKTSYRLSLLLMAGSIVFPDALLANDPTLATAIASSFFAAIAIIAAGQSFATSGESSASKV